MSKVVYDLNAESFRPGEEIKGTVLWDLDKRPRTLELCLGWYTDSRAATESEIVQSWTLPVEQIGEFEFNCPAPLFPYSYEGNILKIRWRFELQTGRRGDRSSRIITIRP